MEKTTERFLIRAILGSLLAIALLTGITLGGIHMIQRWRSHRFVAQSQAALAGGDIRAGVFAARAALAADHDNISALRILAEVSERTHQRSAIDWRERVVAKSPDSADDLVALAKAALQFDEPAVAESALSKVHPNATNIPAYHQARAQLAIAKKDPATARAEYAEASRLDPANQNYQLNVAVFDLQSPDPEIRLKASHFLQSLLDSPTLRVPAAKALFDYAVQRRDPAVVSIATLLFDYPETSFRERLRCAEIFKEFSQEKYPSFLTKLEDAAATDAAKATDLLAWFATTNQSTLAIDWTTRLPESLLVQRPVFVALADCYVAANDCIKLQQWCKKFDWKDLEFLRHAYLALALRDCKKGLDADLEWSKAVQSTSNSDELRTLQEDTTKWGWTEKSIDVLWRLAKDPDTAKPALTALYQHYSALSDTLNLYRVAVGSGQIAPEDTTAQNNLAQLSLLLNVDVENATEIAQRLHEREPQNAAFASTYAYALLCQKRTAQALQVMNTLPNEQLQKPEIAAYYGVILSAAGDKEKARYFLEIGSKAKLLPEERSLLEKAARH